MNLKNWKKRIYPGNQNSLIQIDDLEIELFRSKRKSISLQIKKDLSVIVRAPVYLSQKRIEEFVKSKKSWLSKHKLKLKLDRERLEEKLVKDSLFFKGEWIPVQYSPNVHSLTFDGNIFCTPEIDFKRTVELFEKYCKVKAKGDFLETAQRLSAEMKVSFNSVKISSARKRWGSCSSLGNINLSWKLMLCPTYVKNYVIIHELAHLKHPNHSKHFWDFVESKDSFYQESEHWLDNFGDIVHLQFDFFKN